MKEGRSLQELAAELERQRETRRDFIAPLGRLRVDLPAVGSKEPVMIIPQNGSEEVVGINALAHNQIQDYLKIPKRYYDKMREEAPELLAANVNTWFERSPATQRMVRTLDGSARAFLSGKYKPMDNIELADAVLPTLVEKGCQVRSAQITDRRLYIKATLPSLLLPDPGPRRVGQFVEAGVMISNSEVGLGYLKIEPIAHLLACLNGVVTAHSIKKMHAGRQAAIEAEVYELLSTKTKRLTDAAFWNQVKDITASAFDAKLFEDFVGTMENATKDEIKSEDIPAVVELTVEHFGLPAKANNGILKHLIAGGDLTRYGMMNAVTATANDWDDYEEATDLERAGGQVLELKPTEWETIAA